MAKVKILLDPIGNVMNIWWDDPKKAHQSIEVDDPHRNDVISKNKQGKPIGLEIIGVFPKELNVSRFVKQITGKKMSTPFLLHT